MAGITAPVCLGDVATDDGAAAPEEERCEAWTAHARPEIAGATRVRRWSRWFLGVADPQRVDM